MIVLVKDQILNISNLQVVTNLLRCSHCLVLGWIRPSHIPQCNTHGRLFVLLFGSSYLLYLYCHSLIAQSRLFSGIFAQSLSIAQGSKIPSLAIALMNGIIGSTSFAFCFQSYVFEGLLSVN